jgi:hypothetical protein
MSDFEVRYMKEHGPRAALVECLMNDDEYGLWEISAWFKGIGVPLEETKRVVSELWRDGVTYVEGRTGTPSVKAPLPLDFDLKDDAIWKWPEHAPPVLFWAGVVEDA